MIEMRYAVLPGWDGPEKVLQYRQQVSITDYSIKDNTGKYISNIVWTSWEDVPVVEMIRDIDENI
jgi:hypothetical protein